jgi:hypothetical protein
VTQLTDSLASGDFHFVRSAGLNVVTDFAHSIVPFGGWKSFTRSKL